MSDFISPCILCMKYKPIHLDMHCFKMAVYVSILIFYGFIRRKFISRNFLIKRICPCLTHDLRGSFYKGKIISSLSRSKKFILNK